MLESTELERRKPIWKVLSEFYLDTELQSTDYDSIAKVMMASGLPLSQLKVIDRFEVFPVLKNNLLGPAGVWTAFDEEWLYEKCTRAYQKSGYTLVRWKNTLLHTLFRGMTKLQWKEIEKRIH